MLVNLFSTEMPDPKKIEEVLNQKFLSKDKFAEDIESLVLHSKMNYIDAIVKYCEDNGIEIETVNKLVNKPLKEKLRWEATELNYLKKTSRGRLPL